MDFYKLFYLFITLFIVANCGNPTGKQGGNYTNPVSEETSKHVGEGFGVIDNMSSPAQIAALTAAQIRALSDSQIRALTAAQIATLNNTQIAALNNTQIAVLTPAQIKALTTAQIAALPTSLVAALKDEQLASLSQTQVQSFSMQQLGALTLQQVQDLGVQVESLSDSQLTSLTNAELDEFRDAEFADLNIAGKTHDLTVSQLQSLTLSELNIVTLPASPYSNTQANIQQLTGQLDVSKLTARQMSWLSSGQIGSLTAAQIPNLALWQIIALSPTQIPFFSPSQISALTPTQISALTATQIPALTPTQIPALTPAQIPALTATQILALTTPQIKALTLVQIRAFTQPQLDRLSQSASTVLRTLQFGPTSYNGYPLQKATSIGRCEIRYSGTNSSCAGIQLNASGSVNAIAGNNSLTTVGTNSTCVSYTNFAGCFSQCTTFSGVSGCSLAGTAFTAGWDTTKEFLTYGKIDGKTNYNLATGAACRISKNRTAINKASDSDDSIYNSKHTRKRSAGMLDQEDIGGMPLVLNGYSRNTDSIMTWQECKSICQSEIKISATQNGSSGQTGYEKGDPQYAQKYYEKAPDCTFTNSEFYYGNQGSPFAVWSSLESLFPPPH